MSNDEGWGCFVICGLGVFFLCNTIDHYLKLSFGEHWFGYLLLAIVLLAVAVYLVCMLIVLAILLPDKLRNKRRLKTLRLQIKKLQKQKQNILKRVEVRANVTRRDPYRSFPDMSPSEYVRWRIEVAPDNPDEAAELVALEEEIMTLETELRKITKKSSHPEPSDSKKPES